MPPPTERPPFAIGQAALLSGLKLLLHFVVNARSPYGFHRDEFLYLALGRHLQLWRMDFPPAIAMVAEATRALLGDSLVAIRMPAALAGTAVLLLASLVARELGGGRMAQGLAALAVLASPLFLRASNLFQPVVLDQLTWSLALYALVRLCRTDAPRWWIGLGAALGLGLLTKFSALFLGLAILLALLCSQRRRALLGPWPWVAAAIALAIGSPSIVGQVRLDFPVLGQMADLRATQLERVTAWEFMINQLLWGPTTLLGLAGGVALLTSERLRPFRPVGWSCLWVFVILLVLHGKAYYAGSLYPTLFAAGAVLIAGTRAGRLGTALRWGPAALIVAYGAVLLPFGLPLLPPESMASYARAIGATQALRTNTGELGRLPQDYADMLGWEAQAAAVARVYHALPPDQREKAVLLAGNYGEAGALDFFGPRYHLPPAVSPAGSYWFFGPGNKPGEVAVTIGIGQANLERFFDSMAPAARLREPWAVSEEQDLTVFLATHPRLTLQQVWPTLAGRN
jgi:4-amino-4-deoxy-L-arabinose transferase-like glycosyltransferase